MRVDGNQSSDDGPWVPQYPPSARRVSADRAADRITFTLHV